MQLKTGDMFRNLNPQVKALFVTTNSFVKRSGALVMGRGAALTAKRQYPGLDLALGKQVKARSGHLKRYGLVWIQRNGTPPIVGAFQVKYAWYDRANLDLIRYSTERLSEFAERVDGLIYLNFPGIGNGKLAFDDVLPIVSTLPDNVYVWTL